MEHENEISRVDGFRFLSQLHTTARQLEICSEIVIALGNSQKLKISLFDSMIAWSLNKEMSEIGYSDSKGKLTDRDKPTTAFNHYLELCKALGLINEFSGIFANSRISFILRHFLVEDSLTLKFNAIEKCYYLYLLLTKDADGILLVLTTLNNGPVNQLTLQNTFQEQLNYRLITKQNLSSNFTKSIISEKYRAINYIWKNPKKYAEHLLIPRCEWLNQLELISINKNKGSTIYSLSEKGILFLNLLPNLFHTNMKDIDDCWMTENVFTVFSKIYSSDFNTKLIDFSESTKSFLGKSLETAIHVIKSSNLFRIPSFDSLLFLCLNMIKEYNILINISDVINILEEGLTYNGKLYLIKNSGRLNESYITTRPL